MGRLRMASKPAKRPKGNDSYADVKRALDAALERRTGETGKQRQRAFGGKRQACPQTHVGGR